MRKADFKSPCSSDIFPGNIIQLYDERGVALGLVELIEPRPSRYFEEFSYVRAEIGGTPKQDSHLIIWEKARWLVKLEDGFITTKYVHYFKEESNDE